MTTNPQRKPVTRIKAQPEGRRALDFDTLILEQAKRVASLRRYIVEMWQRRSLVQVLAGRKLKSEYEMNIIGFVWWLTEPLSLTAVYWVLVSVLQSGTKPSYVLFILASMLSFKWLMQGLIGAMTTVRSNATLVQDVYFPRALLPITEVTIGLAHFCVGLLVFPVFLLAFGIPFTAQLLWLPLVIAVQYVLMLGIAYPLAVWGLNYRNLPGLIGNMLRLWFYLSPSLWDLSRLKNPNARFIVHLNPLTGLFRSYRGALGVPTADGIPHPHPPGLDLAWSALVGIVFLGLGIWYFTRREAQFGKML
jgi:lipopolysaccharide transport system permease protein